jgi:hypothetical protein
MFGISLSVKTCAQLKFLLGDTIAALIISVASGSIMGALELVLEDTVVMFTASTADDSNGGEVEVGVMVAVLTFK